MVDAAKRTAPSELPLELPARLLGRDVESLLLDQKTKEWRDRRLFARRGGGLPPLLLLFLATSSRPRTAPPSSSSSSSSNSSSSPN